MNYLHYDDGWKRSSTSYQSPHDELEEDDDVSSIRWNHGESGDNDHDGGLEWSTEYGEHESKHIFGRDRHRHFGLGLDGSNMSHAGPPPKTPSSFGLGSKLLDCCQKPVLKIDFQIARNLVDIILRLHQLVASPIFGKCLSFNCESMTACSFFLKLTPC